MTDKIELLPLPEDYVNDEGLWEKRYGPYSLEQMEDYARANVARAVEPLQAEIEALRAEVDVMKAENERLAELRYRLETANAYGQQCDEDIRRLQARVAELEAENEALRAEVERLWAEVSELRAARIAYANEFPATKDGDPDTGNIHANIRALKVRADKLEKTLRAYQKAVNRIDDLIEYALPMPRETKGALYSVLADLTEELVKESKGNGQKEAQEL